MYKIKPHSFSRRGGLSVLSSIWLGGEWEGFWRDGGKILVKEGSIIYVTGNCIEIHLDSRAISWMLSYLDVCRMWIWTSGDA